MNVLKGKDPTKFKNSKCAKPSKCVNTLPFSSTQYTNRIANGKIPIHDSRPLGICCKTERNTGPYWRKIVSHNTTESRKDFGQKTHCTSTIHHSQILYPPPNRRMNKTYSMSMSSRYSKSSSPESGACCCWSLVVGFAHCSYMTPAWQGVVASNCGSLPI